MALGPLTATTPLQSRGLNTPVPRAVVTIDGKSYTFGIHTPSSVSSYVDSLNATSPQTILEFALGISSTDLLGSGTGHMRREEER
jgi:hypothetical protein